MRVWQVLLLISIAYVLVAYLVLLFHIVTDLFRDKELSVLGKAVWAIALVVFPLLGFLAYLLVRGNGMSERQEAHAYSQMKAQDEYIRSVAGGGGGAAQVAQAKSLLDSGAITQREFEALKQKALA